ncbi:GNAT family protein [Paenibacillus wenxiniae]|uniref:GNAT family protein n=1 Tax=Paenibacillus wenxiniae TaxID=1636843 RepID=A0ABW4RR17_9BACL
MPQCNRIEAKVLPAHINSIKLLQKLHVVFENTLREYDENNRQFNNLHMYARLKAN